MPINDDDRLALFDMDGTLADYDGRLLSDLGRMASPGEPPPVLSWDDGPVWMQERISAIKSQPGWWLGLKPVPSGFVVFNLAKEIGFIPHVLTKGPRHHPAAWMEKLQWCHRYIHPDVDVTITQDKGLVYGRVLVDDYPDYLSRWLKHRPRGLGLMPAKPYNEGFSHPNIIRYPADLSVGDPTYDLIREALTRAYLRA